MARGVYNHWKLKEYYKLGIAKQGFKKGHIPWNKGKKIPEETRKKLSKSLKGKNIGHPCYYRTDIFKKGHKIRNTGRTHFKKGHIPWNKGLTKEIDKRVAKIGNRNKRIFTKELIRKILKRRIPSGLEQRMINIIQKLKLPYKFVGNGKFFIENKNPDFINCNGEKIAIEVFYRKHKNIFRGNNNDWENIEKWKQERQAIFNKYGWKIIFLNETQINEENIKRCLI